MCELEGLGFRLLSSLRRDEPTCLAGPGKRPQLFPLFRDHGQIFLIARVESPGRLKVVDPSYWGTPGTERVLLDTGANATCCGERHLALLVRPCSSRAVGGVTQAACPAPLCGRLVGVVYYE